MMKKHDSIAFKQADVSVIINMFLLLTHGHQWLGRHGNFTENKMISFSTLEWWVLAWLSVWS